MLGVRIKSGNQGLEIHGNDATIIEIEGGKEAEPVITRDSFNIDKLKMEKI